MQDLTFIEFFAGAGNCWRAVRADSQYACGLDLEYLKVEAGQNPFDILSNAGMASLCHASTIMSEM